MSPKDYGEIQLQIQYRLVEELSSAERRYRQLIEALREPLFECDEQGRLVFVNGAWSEVLGFTAEESLGRPAVDFLHPEDSTTGRMWLEDSADGAQRAAPQHQEVRVQHRNGTLRWVELSVRAKGDGGRVGMLHDVTERKQAAEAALELARTKSRFMANMSHEIRTPLNGILGMLDLVGQTDLGREQKECIETAQQSAESLLSILKDILDFSKIEAGRLELEHISFNLPGLVENVAALFSAQAHSKNIELLCFVPTNIPNSVIGDPTRLGQVLTNLVGNALKFTERGQVTLKVKLMGIAEDKVSIHFEVQDTGIGMCEADIARLFAPFRQVDTSTTRRFGGTGLGLAISRDLVELMGGSMEVTSTPREGSTFRFTIGLGFVGLAKEAAGELSLKGLRALLIDDNPTNLKILQHYLTGLGMVTESVDSAEQALRRLHLAVANGSPFDLALLDLYMPGMGGLELARVIKQDAAVSQTALVLLSSGSPSKAELDAAGIALNLTKPIRQTPLRVALIEWLKGGRASLRPARSSPAAGRPLRAKVLLAEDNLVNQQVATRMLKKLGLAVELAHNGQEALQKQRDDRYDLVLMDCEMPVLDGYGATGQWRSYEAIKGLARTPIVAMTANAMPGDREACLAAGMDDYLAKPVKLEALRTTLTHWLAEPRSPEREQRPLQRVSQ